MMIFFSFLFLSVFIIRILSYRSAGLIKHWLDQKQTNARMVIKQINHDDDHHQNDNHGDGDYSIDIVRTSSVHLQILFKMYLAFTTISIMMCIVEILKFKNFFHIFTIFISKNNQSISTPITKFNYQSK